MHDDRFDEHLAERLRAYESRIPDEEAPDSIASSRRRGLGWPILAAGATAAVAAVGLAVVVLLNALPSNVGDTGPSPSADVSPTSSAFASPAPSAPTATPEPSAPEASPPPTAPAVTTDLEWTVASSFGSDMTIERVSAMTTFDGGIVAVGTFFDAQYMQIFGLPPHAGRVWLSTDGQAWEAIDVGSGLDDVELDHVLTAADGTVIALGGNGDPIDGPITPGAWASADGRSWEPIDLGLPTGMVVRKAVQGDRGYVAWLAGSEVDASDELWRSTDGRSWTLSMALPAGASLFDVDAGPEGFVAVGSQGDDATPSPLAMASADGVQWFDAAPAPDDASTVSPLGPDWIVTSFTVDNSGGQSTWDVSSWFSANGIDWTLGAPIPLGGIDRGDGFFCADAPTGLHGAGGWLILETGLGGCGEGGFVRYGTPRLSVDGAIWVELPFPAADVNGRQLGSGALAALAFDGSLVIAGESQGYATFWIGEASQSD